MKKTFGQKLIESLKEFIDKIDDIEGNFATTTYMVDEKGKIVRKTTKPKEKNGIQ